MSVEKLIIDERHNDALVAFFKAPTDQNAIPVLRLAEEFAEDAGLKGIIYNALAKEGFSRNVIDAIEAGTRTFGDDFWKIKIVGDFLTTTHISPPEELKTWFLSSEPTLEHTTVLRKCLRYYKETMLSYEEEQKARMVLEASQKLRELGFKDFKMAVISASPDGEVKMTTLDGKPLTSTDLFQGDSDIDGPSF